MGRIAFMQHRLQLGSVVQHWIWVAKCTTTKTSTTRVPVIMEELIPAGITEGMVEPKSTASTQKELSKPELLHAKASDFAFFCVHNNSDKKIGWTSFNGAM